MEEVIKKFSDTSNSKVSIATCLRCGVTFNDHVIVNLLLGVSVKNSENW